MPHPKNSLAFVGELQSALTVEEIAQVYVGAVRDVIFARGRGLYRVDPDSHSLVDPVADVPQHFLDEYAAIRPEDDPVLEAAIAANRAVASSDRALAPAWAASPASKLLQSFGFAHSLKAPLVVDNVVWGSIHFTRYATDPPFAHGDRVAAELVVQHLGAALGRALRHEKTSWRVSVLAAALDSVTQPVIVTDRDGARVYSNKAATNGTGTTRPVVELVGPTLAHTHELMTQDGRRVVVASVEESPDRLMSVRSVALPQYDVTVSVVYPRSDTPSRELPSLGILSKREQEIAVFVSQGLSTQEIAERAFITENTVKQHLKRIFSKLNVRNRAEMVQVMWAATTSSPRDSR